MCVHTREADSSKIGKNANLDNLKARAEIDKLTDYKSTVGQLYKWSINVDWCEVFTHGYLFKTADEEPPKELTVVTPAGNALEVIQRRASAGDYSYLYHLKFVGDEEPFAQVVTLPWKGSILDRSASQFRVLNHRLYSKSWPLLFLDILMAFGVSVRSITRLDVAVDSNKDLLKVYDDYVRGNLEAKGRSINHRPEYSGRELSLFHWGSLKSNKQAKGYRKGSRIEQENKHYIVEGWKRDGLVSQDATPEELKDITRFEVTLKGDAIKRMLELETGELGIDISRLDDAKYLAGLVRAAIKNWFTFLIPSSTDSNKSRWKKVPHIDFDALGALQIDRLPKTKTSSQTWRAKHTAKKLISDIENESYLQDSCKEYFQERCKIEIDEARLKKLQDAAKVYLSTKWRYSVPANVVDEMIQGLFQQGLLNGLFVDVVDQFSQEIPLLIAGRIAERHRLLNWLYRQTQKEPLSAGEAFLKKHRERLSKAA